MAEMPSPDGRKMRKWRNDDEKGNVIPDWIGDVAVNLTGGRFAVETHSGTKILELCMWIGIDDGVVTVSTEEPQ
jgi:hypothetical protein